MMMALLEDNKVSCFILYEGVRLRILRCICTIETELRVRVSSYMNAI